MKKMFRIFMEFSKADEHLHSNRNQNSKLKNKSNKNSEVNEEENMAELLSKIAQS